MLIPIIILIVPMCVKFEWNTLTLSLRRIHAVLNTVYKLGAYCSTRTYKYTMAMGDAVITVNAA